MSEPRVGFISQAGARDGAEVGEIGVGMLGYQFMGKAHSNAYKTLRYMTWPPPLRPETVLELFSGLPGKVAAKIYAPPVAAAVCY